MVNLQRFDFTLHFSDPILQVKGKIGNDICKYNDYSVMYNICCLTEEMFATMNKHLINLDNGGYNIGYDGTFSIQRQQ